MESNPRARIPAEWAPPPPVSIPQAPVPAPDIPAPSTEQEFDSILGNLVEHYAALPPASYGEPPAMADMEPTTRTARHSNLDIWLGLAGGVALLCVALVALVLTGVVRFDSVLGMARAPAVTAPAPQVATPPAPAPAKVAVVPTPLVEPISGPKVEPLSDPPEAVATAAEEPAGAAHPAPAPAEERKVASRPAKLKRARKDGPTGQKAATMDVAPAVETAARPAPAPAAAGAPDSDWADPY